MALIECPECNKQVSDKADICIDCGYPLDQITDLKCPECGIIVLTDTTSCPECGYPIADEKKVSSYNSTGIITDNNFQKPDSSAIRQSHYESDDYAQAETIDRKTETPQEKVEQAASGKLFLICTLIVLVLGGVYYYGFGMKRQLIKDLRSKGAAVVEIKNLVKIQGLNDCYTFSAIYESSRNNKVVRYGIDKQDFTVKFINGHIVNGLADNTGLMATAVQVCREYALTPEKYREMEKIIDDHNNSK